MTNNADIVIIGAGIVGLNIAYQIARRSNARIIVLEKGVGVGEGSSGASSAVCRYRYSHAEMVALARDGIHAYQNWSDYLGLKDPRAVFHRHGVLWLSADDPYWAAQESARLAELGVKTAAIDDAEVHRRFPALSECGLAPDLETGADHDCRPGGGIHLLELDGGYVEPVDALQDLVDCLRLRPVDLRFGCEVARIEVEGGAIRGVALASGEKISCATVVNAAGPWCNSLTESAGLELDWPLEPTRIQIVHLERPASVFGAIPVTCDLKAGIYFRSQNRGQQIIVGSILEEDEREHVDHPDRFARYVDDDFLHKKLHALHHRIPELTMRGIRGYSGLYTINRADMHPVVGATQIEGLFLANGCSGHGFKLAPAIGSLLAQAIVGSSLADDTKVDPDFLAVGRTPISVSSMSVLA